MTQALCCPKCKGTSGVQWSRKETCTFGAGWGGEPYLGDTGINIRLSLAVCDDCGAKFQLRALAQKGLVLVDGYEEGR